MADETNEGFLASLPFIGSFFKNPTEVIDTPIKSTPIPDSGSLDTTPMVVLPDEPSAKAVNSPPTNPPSATPEVPTSTPSTTKP